MWLTFFVGCLLVMLSGYVNCRHHVVIEDRTIDLRNNADFHGNISVKHYTKVIDLDGTEFLLRKLNVSFSSRTCFDAVKDDLSQPFCYPSLNIPGYAKCGTSAMYEFLRSHKYIFFGHKTKEKCPKDSVFSFLRGLSNAYHPKGSLAVINGCINTKLTLMLHQLLSPKTAYVFMVRNVADRAWAAYNYWCIPSADGNATGSCVPGAYTQKETVRSPEIFDEWVHGGKHYQCSTYESVYTNLINSLTKITEVPPIVISMDSLRTEEGKATQVLRLEKYLQERLQLPFISLNATLLKRYNAGELISNRGASRVAHDSASEGVYEVSGYRPLLNRTRAKIMTCWKECKEVAKLSMFPYDC
jgi:hypothetical protein